MKTCPFCGAEIQENAQFCLYCMQSLDKKKHISSVRRSSKTKVIITAALILIVLSVVILCIVIFSGKEAGQAVSSDIAQSGSDVSKETGDEVATDHSVISTFDDFVLRAIYLTGKTDLSGLWDPDGFVNTHTGVDSDGDTWMIYSTDVKIENAVFKTHFCNGGEEIITTITGLTDETYADGVKLAECAVSSVYNYTYTNLKDLLTDRDAYPLKDMPDDATIMKLSELPDPAADLSDPGTVPTSLYTGCSFDSEEITLNTFFFELRTRIYGGETVYDIILLHSQN